MYIADTIIMPAMLIKYSPNTYEILLYLLPMMYTMIIGNTNSADKNIPISSVISITKFNNICNIKIIISIFYYNVLIRKSKVENL